MMCGFYAKTSRDCLRLQTNGCFFFFSVFSLFVLKTNRTSFYLLNSSVSILIFSTLYSHSFIVCYLMVVFRYVFCIIIWINNSIETKVVFCIILVTKNNSVMAMLSVQCFIVEHIIKRYNFFHVYAASILCLWNFIKIFSYSHAIDYCVVILLNVCFCTCLTFYK